MKYQKLKPGDVRQDGDQFKVKEAMRTTHGNTEEWTDVSPQMVGVPIDAHHAMQNDYRRPIEE